MKRTISFVMICALMMVLLTSCGSKTAITDEDFVSKAKGMGYEISDVTPEASDYDYVVSSSAALKPDVSEDAWYVFFTVAKTKNDAEEMFEHNKKEYSNGVSTNVTESSGNNYATYKGNKDGMFYYASYIDNTMLLIEVNSEFKEEAEKLITDLGY